MSMIETLPRLISHGFELDQSPERFGLMRNSSDLLEDVAALRGRMQTDGYLLLRGLLDRELVLSARRELTNRLAREGFLEPGTDPMDGIAATSKNPGWYPDLAKGNAPLRETLYGGRMMEFFARYLAGEVRHFDYTWLRAVVPGVGTPSHCDIVYMGRGTKNLFTAWTPIGDIGFEPGGLMILEGSNNNQRLRETYGSRDVDTHCTNKPAPAASKDSWEKGYNGSLSGNPGQIRKSLGGRWVTAEYEAGDVLIFTMYTIHASLDNTSRQMRLSTDTRYQLASEPVDERWIGENPIAHGPAGKRGMIC